MPAPHSTRTLRDFVGHGFGTSAPTIVHQERINTFADVSWNHQWIHVDVASAKAEIPFGGPVAHGFLTLSLLAAAYGSAGVIPDAINYGLDRIRFTAPMSAGKRVVASFKLTEVEDKGPKGSDKPALAGDVPVLVS